MSLIEADLALLRTAALFDLSSPEGRKASVAALRGLYYRLHEVLKPRASLEIGAKEATYSRTVRKLLPDCRAIAFEANPYVFRKERKRDDPANDGVDYRHLAVSSATGETSFFVQTHRGGREVKKTMGSNSMMARLGDVTTEEVTVPCTRVDDFFAAEGLEQPLVAWIDVEGAIGHVLPGMETVLDQFMMVFCEVEEKAFWDKQWTWPNVHRFMSERGFHAVARDFEYDGQNNVLFLREDILARSDVRQALIGWYGGARYQVEEVSPAAREASRAAAAAS